ncbi:MAG TPA: response regulator transcription factor [Myxococcota bacterium]|jgi:DNA-binding response OmpR family regulator|nr:response regulator transcription factor [Myxococcota bacterium]
MKPDETILVVEDDESLARGIAHNLRYEGYRVLQAADGPTGLRLAFDARPDLVILDLMLPRMRGQDVLAAMREAGLATQVIILSARGQEADKVAGLRGGADDYVTKPFGVPELLARVEAALRRPREARRDDASRELAFGTVRLLPGRRQVLRDGVEVRLTGREFDLLLFLATHPDRAFDRETLLQRVWGWDYEGTPRTIDNFIHSLRAKIEDDPSAPRHLRTVVGIGYSFTAD